MVKLRPECYEEYKKCHAAVWPEVLQQIKECNIEDCKSNLLVESRATLINCMRSRCALSFLLAAVHPIFTKGFGSTYLLVCAVVGHVAQDPEFYAP